jgi:hypothetical protein
MAASAASRSIHIGSKTWPSRSSKLRPYDRQHLTPRRLDIQREVGRVGTDGVEDGREGLGFRQVGGQGRPFRVAKARAVEQRRSVWVGRALSSLVILFLTMDAAMKIAALPIVAETAPTIGWTADPGFWQGIGLLLLAITALYAWALATAVGSRVIGGRSARRTPPAAANPAIHGSQPRGQIGHRACRPGHRRHG